MSLDVVQKFVWELKIEKGIFYFFCKTLVENPSTSFKRPLKSQTPKDFKLCMNEVARII
jgi:hypothetical protein